MVGATPILIGEAMVTVARGTDTPPTFGALVGTGHD